MVRRSYRRRSSRVYRSRPKRYSRSYSRSRRGSRVRRSGYRRRSRVSDATVYRFKRKSITKFEASNNNTQIVAGGVDYNLANVPDILGLSDMFEEYKITKVTYKFMPRQGFTYAASDDHGVFAMWNDYDDTTDPSLDEYMAKTGPIVVKNINRTNAPFFWSVRPKYQVPVYAGSFGAFGYVPKRGAWLKTSDLAVHYYGSKWIWYGTRYTATPPVNPPYTINAEITYHLKFRKPKYTGAP